MVFASSLVLLALGAPFHAPLADEQRIEARAESHATRWVWKEEGDLQLAGDEASWALLMWYLGKPYTGVRLTLAREVVCLERVQHARDSGRRIVERTIEGAQARMELSAMADDLLELHELELSSALADRRVRLIHTGDEEQSAWEFADDEEGEPELLLDLRPDFEPLALLPPGPVALGATWKIDLDEISGVLLPGGLPALRLPEDQGLELTLLSLASISELVRDASHFGGEYDGRARGRYRGLVTSGDRSLAQIDVELRCDVSCAWDGTFSRRIGMEDGDGFDLLVESALVGQGRLFWDIERGRLSSFELDLSAEHWIRHESSRKPIEGLVFRSTRRLQLEAREVTTDDCE